MDVARIEAISPKQIDWRKLTAKEIIKYESTGVEVPSEYLQWARAFRADLQANDTDEVTYENALDTSTSSYVNNSANTDIDGNGSELEKPTQNEDEEPLTANQKYKQMRENGDSLYKIGKIFRDDCNTKAGASEDSSSTLGVIDATSNNEIEALESYMSDFLSKATDIKTQIASLKNKKTDTDFAKINRLQDELKNLGISGQGVVAQYGGDMNGFKSVIDSQVDIGPDAKDYGVESIDIAKKLMGYFWYIKIVWMEILKNLIKFLVINLIFQIKPELLLLLAKMKIQKQTLRIAIIRNKNQKKLCKPHKMMAQIRLQKQLLTLMKF